MEKILTDTARQISVYLSHLDPQRARDCVNDKYGNEKGSILHMLINKHLKENAEIAIEKLEVLLTHGARLEQADSYGNNVVMHAVKLGQHKLAEYLIVKATVKVLMESNKYGMNLLHISALRGHWFIFDRIRKKIDHRGLDKLMQQKTSKPFTRYVPTLGKTVDVNSWTPLHFSAIYCHLDCVKWLVKYGANTKAVNAEGITAGEFLTSCHFVKSGAIAKQCYGYIVAGTKNAKVEEGQSSLVPERVQSVKKNVDIGKTASDKNLTARERREGEPSKIITDVDVYLSFYGLNVQDVARMIKKEIDNGPQPSEDIETVNLEQKSKVPTTPTKQSHSGHVSTEPAQKDSVKNRKDKDLAFLQNLLGDFLSEHDVDYEYLLSEIKARFVDGADEDSETNSYHGYSSSSFESYDSDDFENDSIDEEDTFRSGQIAANRGVIPAPQLDDSDEDIPEEDMPESSARPQSVQLNFCRPKMTGEMVMRSETKKAIAVFPSDATIRDIAIDIPTSKLTMFGRYLGFSPRELEQVEPGKSSEAKAKALLILWRKKQTNKRATVLQIKALLETVLHELGMNYIFQE